MVEKTQENGRRNPVKNSVNYGWQPFEWGSAGGGGGQLSNGRHRVTCHCRFSFVFFLPSSSFRFFLLLLLPPFVSVPRSHWQRPPLSVGASQSSSSSSSFSSFSSLGCSVRRRRNQWPWRKRVLQGGRNNNNNNSNNNVRLIGRVESGDSCDIPRQKRSICSSANQNARNGGGVALFITQSGAVGRRVLANI